MQVPLQITLRNIPHSDALEQRIRDKAAKLEPLNLRITSFGITVEVNEIVAAPEVMVLTELNAGVAVAHDFGTKPSPTGAVRTSPLASP